MEQNLNYQIFPDKKLIVEYYYGSVRLNDLILYQNNVSFDKYYNPNYNVINDYRDAKLILNEKDIVKYINFIKTSPKLYGSRRIAQITNSPDQVVITTLFNLLKSDLPVKVHVVSTLGAAINWVGLDYTDRDLVEACIVGIKSQVAAIG